MMDLPHLVGVLRRLWEDPSVVSATLDLGLRRITVEVRLPDLAPLLESAADEYRAMGWRVDFDLSGDSPTVVVRAPRGEVGQVLSLAEGRGDSVLEVRVSSGRSRDVEVRIEASGATVEEVAAVEAREALRRAGLPGAESMPAELETVTRDASVPVFLPTGTGSTRGLVAAVSVCLPPRLGEP